MAYRICAQIKRGGDRCGSPALKGETLCHHHYRFCKRRRTLTVSRHGAMPREESEQPQKPPVNLECFAPLNSARSILRATSFVMRELAADRLKTKQAGMLLFGLQTASLNLRRSR